MSKKPIFTAAQPQTTQLQNVLRVILGLFMIVAAIGHLTFQRAEFQAQVPNWIPISKDLTVVLSGLVEAGFGLALLFWKSQRVKVGIALAIFYLLIFPGNIAQYLNHTDAFGLDTDGTRLARLFLQPVLMAWVLWCKGAMAYLKNKIRRH